MYSLPIDRGIHSDIMIDREKEFGSESDSSQSAIEKEKQELREELIRKYVLQCRKEDVIPLPTV